MAGSSDDRFGRCQNADLNVSIRASPPVRKVKTQMAGSSDDRFGRCQNADLNVSIRASPPVLRPHPDSYRDSVEGQSNSAERQ
jgi:hypothetical protein